MDQQTHKTLRKTLKRDVQTILARLKEQGKAFSYVGVGIMDDDSFRLRLKADWFSQMDHWEALYIVSNLLFDLYQDKMISEVTFDAIMGIDILPDDAPEESIPLALFDTYDFSTPQYRIVIPTAEVLEGKYRGTKNFTFEHYHIVP